MRVGVLGCGTIGGSVVEALVNERVPHVDLGGISTRTPEVAHDVFERLATADDVAIVDSPVSMADEVDVVVEAASQDAVADHAVSILERGTDLVALSVGALTDPSLLGRVRTAATAGESCLRVPSGAIVGLDGVAGLAASGVTAVSLTGYRPPSMLEPYVDDGVSLADQDSGTTIFAGSGDAAAEAFPAHMNIAIAVALAADVDPDAVEVRLVLDHDAPRSRYVVEASGLAGNLTCQIENVTMPSAGDATHLVIDATLATLERLAGPISIGT